MKIKIAPRKKDVKTLSLDIIKKNGLSVKFKTKLYHKGFNDLDMYYHQEYIYNQNHQMSMNLNLNLNSFIQFTISNDNYKEDLVMTEVSRNKFIRKTNKFIGLVEAYDSEDIDLIQVDSSGTHIATCFKDMSHIELSLNKKILKLQVIIRDEIGDVGILISIDDNNSILSIYDFLDMVYKLRSINFITTALNLVNYFGSPDLGENTTDFRKDVPVNNDYYNVLSGGGSNTNNFDGLKSNNINNNSKTNNKINW